MSRGDASMIPGWIPYVGFTPPQGQCQYDLSVWIPFYGFTPPAYENIFLPISRGWGSMIPGFVPFSGVTPPAYENITYLFS